MLYAAIKYLGDASVPGDLDEQVADGPFSETLETIGGLEGIAVAGAAEASVEHDETREPGPELTDRAARAVGLKGVRTNRQIIELMRRLGMLERIEDDDGVIWWRAVTPLPLPSERIPMSDEERSREDRMRWRALHESLAGRLLEIVREQRVDRLAMSLGATARRLQVDPEDVRQAVLVLLGDGACSASVDVSRARLNEVFELNVGQEPSDRPAR